jgi:hypothetical protein
MCGICCLIGAIPVQQVISYLLHRPPPGVPPLVPDQRTVESGIYAVYKYYNISTNIIVYKIMIPRNNVE